jgi:hypothetical protein
MQTTRSTGIFWGQRILNSVVKIARVAGPRAERAMAPQLSTGAISFRPVPSQRGPEEQRMNDERMS